MIDVNVNTSLSNIDVSVETEENSVDVTIEPTSVSIDVSVDPSIYAVSNPVLEQRVSDLEGWSNDGVMNGGIIM